MAKFDSKNRYLPNKTLKQMLADINRCLRDDMASLRWPDAFVSMCEAWTLELVEINKHLEGLIDRYSNQLPLFNEQPRDVDVEDEALRLEELIEILVSHQYYYEVAEDDPESEEPAPGDLRLQLDELLQRLWNLDHSLHPMRSELYIEYSKAELANYERRPWNQALRNINRQMSDNSVRARLGEYYESQYRDCINVLRTLEPKVISDNNREVYHEAIGHVLWRTGHESDVVIEDLHEVLGAIKAAEHFSKLASHEFVYVDREIGENEVEERGATPEEIKEERLKQKLETVKQTSLEWVIFRIGLCSRYFKKGCTEQWVRQMLYAAFEQKDMREELIAKFNAVSRRKTMYQILGELMDVRFVIDHEDKAMGLAETIAEKMITEKKKLSTTSNYIRLGITDAESLKKWVDEYPLP